LLGTPSQNHISNYAEATVCNMNWRCVFPH